MKKWIALAMMGLSAAAQAEPFEVGDIPVCTALTPAAIAVDNQAVSLDVRVLLDGVSLSRGQTIMNGVTESYAPLGITVISTFATVAFTGQFGSELIAEAKSLFGGERPDGIDLVYVLTDKDISDPATGNALAGLADCIGGVKYADRAFGVGEAWDAEFTDLLLYKLYNDKAIKTAAHEIGHLMGAHHHQANCAESLTNFGGSPCTLMLNFVDVQSQAFSLVNGTVVRGHAQAYATP